VHNGPPGRIYRLSLSIASQSSAGEYAGRLAVGVRDDGSSLAFTVTEDCQISLGGASRQNTRSNAKGAPTDWGADRFASTSYDDRQLRSRWLSTNGAVFSIATFERKG